jgi:hypothetical protein
LVRRQREIYKSSPFTYTDQSVSKTYSELNLTRESFPFCIMINDVAGIPYSNDSIIYSQLRRVVISVDSKTQIKLPKENKLIDLETCQYHHFPQFSKEVLVIPNLDSVCARKSHYLK